ncbi:hypothetical protein V6N13_061289 [Hibiscus sabdariffa]
MFPVVWAIVEVEGKESWKWFLTKLMKGLGHPNGEVLTLMSDQQKGLISVINEFFPLLKHRMCVRHIYANWHKNWKGLNKKIQLWNCCDVVANNLAEAFNGWIVDARCYPIISMLEEIRKMVMQIMHVKRTASSKWKTNIAPRPLQKFERNMDVSNKCRLVWNGDGGFEVTDGGNQHTIDLNNMRCTCREWELTEIPCSHVISAMHHDSNDPRFVFPIGTQRKYMMPVRTMFYNQLWERYSGQK